jgi:hypothetical protein
MINWIYVVKRNVVRNVEELWFHVVRKINVKDGFGKHVLLNFL